MDYLHIKKQEETGSIKQALTNLCVLKYNNQTKIRLLHETLSFAREETPGHMTITLRT